MKNNTLRKTVVIGIVFLFIGLSIVPIINGSIRKIGNLKDIMPGQSSEATNRDIIYVDDDNTEGPWDGTIEHPYQYIQDGIENANSRDTVFVFNGTYYENNIVIRKKINLIGEDKNDTIIDGGGPGEKDILFIRDANRVNINGFTIQNIRMPLSRFKPYPPPSAIKIFSDNNIITGNIIINNDCGIFLFTSRNSTIKRNIITNNSHFGIQIINSPFTSIIDNDLDSIKLGDSYSSIITDNNFFSDGDGITISGINLHHWNTHTIDNNYVWKKNNYVSRKTIYYYKNNHDGDIIPSDAAQVILANCSNFILQNLNLSDVYAGIQVGFSSCNTISGNEISNNKWYSIYLESSSNNNISENTITTHGYYGVYLKVSDNNNISGNDISTNDYGIYLGPSGDGRPSSNNDISKNNIADTNYYGVSLVVSDNNIIKRNNIINNSEVGISLEDSSRNIIIDNDFDSGGILLTNGKLSDWNTHTIENNYIHGKPIYYYKNNHNCVTVPSDAAQVILANCSHFIIQNLSFSDVCAGIQLGFSLYSTISGNEISNNSWHSIYLESSSNNNISENNITNNTRNGICLKGAGALCEDNIVTGNTLTNNNIGIYLKSGVYAPCKDNIVTGNTLTNNNIGIYLSSDKDAPCKGNIVTGNTLTDNNYGIYLYDDMLSGPSFMFGNTVTRNTLTNNNYGIYLIHAGRKHALENTLTGNTIENNIEGISLLLNSEKNNISRNTINNNIQGIKLVGYSSQPGNFPKHHSVIAGNNIINNDYGILLYGSSSNTIRGNNITNNTKSGIFLVEESLIPSDNNIIYHNNFINNNQSAYDECDNTWYNDTLKGGNYWSDYMDQHPNPKDEIPPYGIWDDPYNISGRTPPNQDMYPFMNPNGWNGPPGDLDQDSDVDLSDLSILLASYNQDDGGDIDGDGDTDQDDLQILLANYGTGTT